MILEKMNHRWIYAKCPEVGEYLYYVDCDLVVTRKQRLNDCRRDKRLEKMLLEQSTDRYILSIYYTSIYPNKKMLEKIVRLSKGSYRVAFLFSLKKACLDRNRKDHFDYLVKCVIKYFGHDPEILVSAYCDLHDDRIIKALLKHKNAIKQWYDLTTFCYVPEVIEAIRTSNHPERNRYWAACRRWGIREKSNDIRICC